MYPQSRLLEYLTHRTFFRGFTRIELASQPIPLALVHVIGFLDPVDHQGLSIPPYVTQRSELHRQLIPDRVKDVYCPTQIFTTKLCVFVLAFVQVIDHLLALRVLWVFFDPADQAMPVIRFVAIPIVMIGM